jgi:alpha-beta hydrolase superfamily lysophospholipase
MEELTLTRNLDDAEAALCLLAERWPGPIAFFGSSMGAVTALWLTVRRPAGPARRLAAGIALAPALDLEASLASLGGPEGLEGWRASGRLRVVNELVACDLGWGLMEDLAAHRADDLAAAYATPALFVQGMEDASVPWRTVADFASRCPGAGVELHLLPGGDHRLLGWKDRVWDLARCWLAAQGLGTAGVG